MLMMLYKNTIKLDCQLFEDLTRSQRELTRKRTSDLRLSCNSKYIWFTLKNGFHKIADRVYIGNDFWELDEIHKYILTNFNSNGKRFRITRDKNKGEVYLCDGDLKILNIIYDDLN